MPGHLLSPLPLFLGFVRATFFSEGIVSVVNWVGLALVGKTVFGDPDTASPLVVVSGIVLVCVATLMVRSRDLARERREQGEKAELDRRLSDIEVSVEAVVAARDSDIRGGLPVMSPHQFARWAALSAELDRLERRGKEHEIEAEWAFTDKWRETLFAVLRKYLRQDDTEAAERGFWDAADVNSPRGITVAASKLRKGLQWLEGFRERLAPDMLKPEGDE